jgi:2-hydroxy-6-oxonona-2,4-dienedioate hydrolase
LRAQNSFEDALNRAEFTRNDGGDDVGEKTIALGSRWTEVAGGLVHARAALRAPVPAPTVVVLVHGLVIASAYMVPTAERLAPFCHVYVPDLPGYGKSYKPPITLTLPRLADALAEWLDALAIAKAHLVGNSFGCQIIAEFALRYPRKIDRLILQGPTMDPEARSLYRQLMRLAINSRREQPSLGRITFVDYAAAGLRRAAATVQMALRDRIEDKLPLIDAPTLIVRGEKDAVVPQRWAERAAALLPRGELHVIPGAAHTLNYSAPEKFAPIIRSFLELP